MQPAKITPMDEVLTALLPYRRQLIIDCPPAGPGDDHVFAIVERGQLKAVYRRSALKPLPPDYLPRLIGHGYQVEQRLNQPLTHILQKP